MYCSADLLDIPFCVADAMCINSGSNAHQLRVYNTQFQPLGYMKLHDSSVFGPRPGPVSSIAFHSYKPILAASSITGGSVTMFGQPHHLHPSLTSGVVYNSLRDSFALNSRYGNTSSINNAHHR